MNSKLPLLLLMLLACCSDENTMTDRIAQDDELANEVLSPQWDVIEQHFGQPVSQLLRDYYADPQRVLQSSFDLESTVEFDGEKRIHVESFEAINDDCVGGWEGYDKYMELASDGFGGIYFVEPTKDDPEVFLFDYTIGSIQSIEMRLSEFLNAPRLEPIAEEG